MSSTATAPRPTSSDILARPLNSDDAVVRDELRTLMSDSAGLRISRELQADLAQAFAILFGTSDPVTQIERTFPLDTPETVPARDLRARMVLAGGLEVQDDPVRLASGCVLVQLRNPRSGDGMRITPRRPPLHRRGGGALMLGPYDSETRTAADQRRGMTAVDMSITAEFWNDLGGVVWRHGLADLAPMASATLNAIEACVKANRPDALEGPNRRASETVPAQLDEPAVPAPLASVVLTFEERKAIEYELIYEVPEMHPGGETFDNIQDEIVPRMLYACARRNELQLHRRDDVPFDNADTVEWLAQRVHQTTLENVVDRERDDDEYWAIWTSLERKFGIDRRLLGSPVTAQATLHRLEAEGEATEPKGLLRIAERVAAMCDTDPSVRELEEGM